MDIERGDTLEIFLQDKDGRFVAQGAPDQSDMDQMCSHENNLPSRFFTKKRFLTRLTGPGSDMVAVRLETKSSSPGNAGQIIVCSLDGSLLYQKEVANYRWIVPSQTAKFTDLTGDGKPDLIKFVQGKILLSENQSTASKIAFADFVEIDFDVQGLRFNPNLGWFVQDMNGDGIGDIVSNYGFGVNVSYGLGNLEFSRVYGWRPQEALGP